MKDQQAKFEKEISDILERKTKKDQKNDILKIMAKYQGLRLPTIMMMKANQILTEK